MKHEADIVPRPRRIPDASDFARAKAACAAGAPVEHAVVGQWLLTWGKPGRKTFEDWLNDQNG